VSLLDALTGARLLIVDDEQRLVYIWFGGAGVNVYDENGAEVHYFTVGTPDGRYPTPRMVQSAIARVRADA
jgi:hypothetical protein